MIPTEGEDPGEHQDEGGSQEGAEEGSERSIEDENDSGENLPDPDSDEEGKEKTPIPDDLRGKIPKKFKYIEDLVAWGSEAEKAKGKAEKKTADLREEHDDAIAKLDSAEKKGDLNPEERQRIQDEFEEAWANDKVGTLNKIFDARDKKQSEDREKDNDQRSWAKEKKFYQGKYGDDWDSKVGPAIAKICLERPYLKTIEDAVAVYELRRKVSADRDEGEHRDKTTSKKEAFSESSDGGRRASESTVVDKIGEAETMADLDKLRSKIT